MTELPERVLAALAPMPAGYVGLLRTVVDTLAPRREVRALWVSGSVGREAADGGSDLDLILTVSDEMSDRYDDPSVWRSLDPVLCLPLPGLPGSFVITTRSGLRVDAVLEKAGDVAGTPYRRRLAVLDKDGFEVPDSESGSGPDPVSLERLATEFLRQSAIFPYAVLEREDWLLGQESVHSYRTLLYQLFVEANQPQPPMGVKQWSSRLTLEQREVLAGLPLPEPTRESVIAAIAVARRALRTHGRAAVESGGGRWPVEVDQAMAVVWAGAGLPG